MQPLAFRIRDHLWNRSGVGVWKSDSGHLSFRLRLPPIQMIFPMFFTQEINTQNPASAKNEKWLLFWDRFFAKFWLLPGSGSEGKLQNPAGVDSGTPEPWPSLLATLRYWGYITETDRLGVMAQKAEKMLPKILNK